MNITEFLTAVPTDITAPVVPEAGARFMPSAESFSEGLRELILNILPLLRPDLSEAAQISLTVVAAAILVGLVNTISDCVSSVSDLAGAAAICSALLLSTNSLISLAADTIQQMGEYGKLLLPVMAGALAAQGSVTASAALYTGTAAFVAFMEKLISGIFLPMVYLYLALAAAHCALGEESLKRIRDMVKNTVSWCLKTLLTVFLTYMSITGVISGTTDAAALKAAKVTISTFVPVVGSILSDASEAVLVSVGLAKNAAGIYGILALLAVFLRPFLKIAVHYLVLKMTALIVTLVGTKRNAELIQDFSGAMGLLLGMTGSACVLQLISTVCFLKGVG